MFRSIFQLLFGLIATPSKVWPTLPVEERETGLMSRFFFPVLGLLAVMAFVGAFLSQRHFDAAIALKRAIVSFASFYAALYAASYTLQYILRQFYRRTYPIAHWMQFVIYGFSVCYVVDAAMSFFPMVTMLLFLQLYTAVVVWDGVVFYLGIHDQKQRLQLTAIVTIVLMMTPVLCGNLLKMILPGLQAA